MNDRAKAAKNAVPFAHTVDIQDVCNLGMDQAIGIEKKKASWFSPLGKLFQAAAQAIGFCVEMRRNWFPLLAPHALSPVSTVADNSSSPSQPSPDELAYSMDIAIGVQHVAVPRSMASSSVRIAQVRIAQTQPTPDELAFSMDLAIGERFTVLSSSEENVAGSQIPVKELPEPTRALAMAAKAGS